MTLKKQFIVACNYRWYFFSFALSYLHSQIHHPQDTIFGMDEQAPPIWMEPQHVDRDTAQVLLINFLQRENMQTFTSLSNIISTAQTEAFYCAVEYVFCSNQTTI